MPTRLLLDVTKLFQARFATGIQRVVREMLRRREIIAAKLGMEVVVVVASERCYYRLADGDIDALFKPASARTPSVQVQSRWQKRLKRLLGMNLTLYSAVQRREMQRQMTQLTAQLTPVPVDESHIVVLVDYIGAGSTSVGALISANDQGATTIAVIYDIIPMLHPDVVPDTTIHPFKWAFLRTVPAVDGLITIAKSTAEEIRQQPFVERYKVPVESFYLGHDLGTFGLANDTPTIPEAAWSGGLTFVMIGTIEPRKRQSVIVDAFEQLWDEGIDAKLVLIGSIGWQVDEFIKRLRAHREYGKSLFVCHQVGDAELNCALARADATIMASTAEGFGLPIVESLALGTPVLVSDIPVFREIVKDAGCYFSPDDPMAAAEAVRIFIGEQQRYAAAARAFRWIDWNESAMQLADAINGILRKSGRNPPTPGAVMDGEFAHRLDN